MCRKVFIAATGQNSGKTTTSLSLLHVARKRYGRIGFMKPVGPKPADLGGLQVDKDAALMARVYGLEEDIELMSPVVLHSDSTKRVLDGEISTAAMEEKIRRASAEMERKCDFLIIEGAGHSGVGTIIGMSNARVARMLGAPVLIVTGGGIGNVVDAVGMNLALYRAEGVDVRLILVNKLIPEKRERNLRYLKKAFAELGLEVMGGFNYSPILANPTLKRISKILGLPLHGDQSQESRIVHHVQLGAASTQRVADLLQESSLLLVTSSRDELLVMLASLYPIPEYRQKIAGLVIPGVAPISKITQQILDRSNIPYFRTKATTAELFTAIVEDVSKITAEDREKVALVQTLAETELDFAAIETLLWGEGTKVETGGGI